MHPAYIETLNPKHLTLHPQNCSKNTYMNLILNPKSPKPEATTLQLETLKALKHSSPQALDHLRRRVL